MSSVTLPRRAHHLQFIRDHRNSQSCTTDDEGIHNINEKNYYQRSKPTKAFSCDQPEIPSTPSSNRLKHLCSRLKRRLTLTKEHRTCSEESESRVSERRFSRFGNYKSFSSSVDDPSTEFDWPDFEKVYESIPSCLINALPGLDDVSAEEEQSKSLVNIPRTPMNENSIEHMDIFMKCKRGNSFRRNAICQKLDKTQYRGQLDIFIQQIMIEKLMRTWT